MQTAGLLMRDVLRSLKPIFMKSQKITSTRISFCQTSVHQKKMLHVLLTKSSLKNVLELLFRAIQASQPTLLRFLGNGNFSLLHKLPQLTVVYWWQVKSSVGTSIERSGNEFCKNFSYISTCFTGSFYEHQRGVGEPRKIER